MTLADLLREEGFEEGFEEGIEQGKKELAIGIAVKRLTKKFGVMPAVFREKIDSLDSTSLEILNYEIDDFNSLDDVRKYLAL